MSKRSDQNSSKLKSTLGLASKIRMVATQGTRRIGGTSRYTRGNKKNTRRKKRDKYDMIRDEYGNDVTPLSLVEVNDYGSSQFDQLQLDNLAVKEYEATDLKLYLTAFSDSDSDDKNDFKNNDYLQKQSNFHKNNKKKTNIINNQNRDILNDIYYNSSSINQDDDIDMNEIISIKIEETDTIFLLDIPSTKVREEDIELYQEIEKDNKHYEEILNARKHIDNYNNISCETVNSTKRDKKCQAKAVKTKDSAAQVTLWNIHDVNNDNNISENTTYHQLNNNNNNQLNNNNLNNPLLNNNHHVKKKIKNHRASISMSGYYNKSKSINFNKSINSMMMSNSIIQASYLNTNRSMNSARMIEQDNPLSILSTNNNFLHLLRVMEDAVAQNNMHDKILLYRNYPNYINHPYKNDNDEEKKKNVV